MRPCPRPVVGFHSKTAIRFPAPHRKVDLGLLEQPGALQTWPQPWEHGGVVSMFQKLLPDPQLQLFTYGGCTEQQSVVFGSRLEPIGLAARSFWYIQPTGITQEGLKRLLKFQTARALRPFPIPHRFCYKSRIMNLLPAVPGRGGVVVSGEIAEIWRSEATSPPILGSIPGKA